MATTGRLVASARVEEDGSSSTSSGGGSGGVGVEVTGLDLLDSIKIT